MRKIAASLLFLVLPLVSMAATPDEPAGTAPKEKEWTLLVFLNGHNNLDSYGKASDAASATLRWTCGVAGSIGHQRQSAAASSRPSATPRGAAAGRQVAGAAGVGDDAGRAGRWRIADGRGQGAAGLKADTAQPMRSWPYWFQIGFLPPVMVV